MARTYHDAPITAAQMDKVLASMNSVSKASNDGKILCVDDFGFLTAKTQQELHIGAVLEPVTINENSTITPPEGVDGFDSVTVNVSGPAPVLQNKIVTQNSVVTPDTGYDGLGQVTVDVPSSGYPEPTGTVQITANGTVNVKDYASAEVNVPTGITAADNGKVVKNGALVAQTARATAITVNGTYDTTENNSVTVNVSGGGSTPVIYSNDGTLAAFIDQTNNRVVWYFMGFTKAASDIAIPAEMCIGQSGLLYSKAYDSDKETQIGQIGFYNGNIRSWNTSTSQTLAGTFWGVVYSNGGQGQTNPYSDPPA